MADSTHYNYHYSCCGATQRLCVRYHTNNAILTINLFAKLGRGLRDKADFKQEEEQRHGKRWEMRFQQTATNTLSSMGLPVDRKVNPDRENNQSLSLGARERGHQE